MRATVPWPNLFIVGAPRCGTTSLWSWLRSHPDVHMSAVKEPHHFSSIAAPVLRPFIQDREEYLRLFADGADRLFRGEASTFYLGDEHATYAIAETCPDARVIALLREPLERASSHYDLLARRHGFERRGFVEALTDELERWNDLPKGERPYIAWSLYAEDVERYRLAFGDRMLVLFYDDLQRDSRATFRRVLEFLDLDNAFADQLTMERENASMRPRNAFVRRLYQSGPLRTAAWKVLPKRVHPTLLRRILREHRTAPAPAAARELVGDLFADDARRLEGVLGARVPWRETTS